MLTVVQFLETENNSGQPWKNKLYTRSLRKIGFIDNRISMDVAPKAREHWLVKILRENTKENGKGCLILKPIRKIEESEQTPLLHGEYKIESHDDVIVIHPPDTSKFWVFSPKAKANILHAANANVLVICHGGSMWPRRKSAEAFLEQVARTITDEERAD